MTAMKAIVAERGGKVQDVQDVGRSENGKERSRFTSFSRPGELNSLIKHSTNALPIEDNQRTISKINLTLLRRADSMFLK